MATFFLRICSLDADASVSYFWMTTPLAKITYRRRKELSEPTFGIRKGQMGFGCFLLRGLDNIKTETFMVATAFNLRSFYRVWHRQSHKTWKAGSVGVSGFRFRIIFALTIYNTGKNLENGCIKS
jgi:hypothetical protein